MNLKEYSQEVEFKKLIEDYILLLLGMRDNNIVLLNEDKRSLIKLNSLIEFKDKYIYFTPYLNSKLIYGVETSPNYNNFDLTLANKILRKLVSVSYNNFSSNTKLQFKYKNYSYCVANYQAAVQEAIVEHITGKNEKELEGAKLNQTILNLISALEAWSIKTYEGKKMPFGFIVDIENTAKEKVNYINFLEEEFSAILSDGVSSVIFIDRDGNLLRYGSIVDDGKILECEITDQLPLRFSQIIAKSIPENSKRIGVFLLTCGDIMIARNGKVELIKRNGKWSNFGWDSFYYAMSRYKNTQNIKKEVLSSVFATAIDVSLSHSGGIIAIVKDGNALNTFNDEKSKSILSESDNLLENFSVQELTEILKKDGEKEKNIEKRVSKRKILLQLLDGVTEYQNINRKLRSELAGLDGATIIQKDGKVVSFGAIIQNEKGSSGGGRGAAAKRLSDYNGLAIKISADGYIEVYIDKEVKYFIK